MADEEESNLTAAGSVARSESTESSESDAPTRTLRSSKRQTIITRTSIRIKRARLEQTEANTSESNDNDSREGSCEQSECAADTECSLQFANCVAKPGNKIGRANHFHLSCTEHLCKECYEDLARV
jgi:hypothetical protein